MNITIEDMPTSGAFVYKTDEGPGARMTFSKAGDTMIIIDHTEVDSELRGQGVGDELVYFMVQYARDKKLKVMPLCPFTRSVFEKNKEIQDVLR